MKAKVIKSVNIGDFKTDSVYGYKVTFEAGSEWEVELIEDLALPTDAVRCRNGIVLVVLPLDRATMIFGDPIKQLKGVETE